MKLYEITNEITEFQSMVDAGEIPEEAIEDTLAGIELEFDEKADNIASLIKSLNAEAEAIEAEAKALMARAKSKKNNIEHLKSYLSQAFKEIDKSKLETTRNVISFRKSEKVVVEDDLEFYQEYPDFCKVKTEVKPDKTAIKKLLKGGMDIKGCRIEETTNIQIK